MFRRSGSAPPDPDPPSLSHNHWNKILSVTVFEKMPIEQAFSLSAVQPESSNE
jgi:hypothetical protein